MINSSKHNFKGINVEPCSYQLLSSKKWRAKAIIREDNLSEVTEAPLVWDREFDTKKEANNFAVQQAKMFIENKNSIKND